VNASWPLRRLGTTKILGVWIRCSGDERHDVYSALGADGDKVAANAHFEAATRLYDIHEYAKALEEYKAAYLAKLRAWGQSRDSEG
jgi:hypothetical protein